MSDVSFFSCGKVIPAFIDITIERAAINDDKIDLIHKILLIVVF